MILVDKDIIERSKEIFISGYNEEFVKPISYDIHIFLIIVNYCFIPNHDVLLK